MGVVNAAPEAAAVPLKITQSTRSAVNRRGNNQSVPLQRRRRRRLRRLRRLRRKGRGDDDDGPARAGRERRTAAATRTSCRSTVDWPKRQQKEKKKAERAKTAAALAGVRKLPLVAVAVEG